MSMTTEGLLPPCAPAPQYVLRAPKGGRSLCLGELVGEILQLVSLGRIYPNIGKKRDYLTEWPSDAIRFKCSQGQWRSQRYDGELGLVIFETYHRKTEENVVILDCTGDMVVVGLRGVRIPPASALAKPATDAAANPPPPPEERPPSPPKDATPRGRPPEEWSARVACTSQQSQQQRRPAAAFLQLKLRYPDVLKSLQQRRIGLHEVDDAALQAVGVLSHTQRWAILRSVDKLGQPLPSVLPRTPRIKGRPTAWRAHVPRMQPRVVCPRDRCQHVVSSLVDAAVVDLAGLCWCGSCRGQVGEAVLEAGTPPAQFGLQQGWCSFSLLADEAARKPAILPPLPATPRQSPGEDWHVSFQGVDGPERLAAVIRSRSILCPGQHEATYLTTSPSLPVAASLHWQQSTFRTLCPGLQVVVEVRQRPGSYQERPADSEIAALDPRLPQGSLLRVLTTPHATPAALWIKLPDVHTDE
mmetsp:Transcript_25073/g.64042  ORF Transcript_25073/g.64042 Transcript_25073/m.64042 type:complete len:470 (+) Transcript_25073:32-1441(+)